MAPTTTTSLAFGPPLKLCTLLKDSFRDRPCRTAYGRTAKFGHVRYRGGWLAEPGSPARSTARVATTRVTT
jgi:hypothetical protein